MYTLPRVYLSSSTTQHKQCKTLQDALDIIHEITKLLSLRSIEKFASFCERVKDMGRALDIAEPERCLPEEKLPRLEEICHHQLWKDTTREYTLKHWISF